MLYILVAIVHSPQDYVIFEEYDIFYLTNVKFNDFPTCQILKPTIKAAI